MSAPPHALVVATGSGEYWFEQRLDVDPSGLAVRVVEPDVPDDDLAPPTRFQHDPMHTGRNVVRAGEVLRSPGAFSVRYTPLADGSADLQFAWIDRMRPSRPVLVAPARSVRAARPFRVTWRTNDPGSGVAFCAVRLDRRLVARAKGATAAGLVVPGVKPGLHQLSVTCTDRAGNVSAAALRRLRAVP